MEHWFSDALLSEMKRRRINQAALARLIGKPTSTISRWLNRDRMPAFRDLVVVAERLNWELERINKPATLEEAPVGSNSVEVIGQVAAGSAHFREVPPERLTFDVKAWRSARLWPNTRPLDDGRAGTFVKIIGDSMEPDYPDGALLACRPPDGEVPPGTPAILSIPARDEKTFKMISVRYDGKKPKEIVAVPINREHALQYYRPRDVEIQYLVLGFLHLKIDVAIASAPLLRSQKKRLHPEVIE